MAENGHQDETEIPTMVRLREKKLTVDEVLEEEEKDSKHKCDNETECKYTAWECSILIGLKSIKNPNGKKKRADSGVLYKDKNFYRKCDMSLCNCDQKTCTMRYAKRTKNDGKPNLISNSWIKWLEDIDPNFRETNKSMVVLCECHFGDRQFKKLKHDPFAITTCQMYKKLKEENEILNRQVKEMVSDPYIHHFTREVKNSYHWHPLTLCGAINLVEKLGRDKYREVGQIGGFPLPGYHSVLEFGAQLRHGIDPKVLEVVNKMKDEHDTEWITDVITGGPTYYDELDPAEEYQKQCQNNNNLEPSGNHQQSNFILYSANGEATVTSGYGDELATALLCFSQSHV